MSDKNDKGDTPLVTFKLPSKHKNIHKIMELINNELPPLLKTKRRRNKQRKARY